MSLLLPLGLAALAALIVPIVVHLIRRPEQDVIDFAALRWLGERARPRRRLRFDDPWLLLLRLLLLAAIALLIAQPVLERDPRGHGTLVAVVPGIDTVLARATVEAADADWRWLAPGFPALDQAAPASTREMSSLVRELDAQLDEQRALIVIVPETLDGLDSERVRLQRVIDWRVVAAPDAPKATPVERMSRRLVIAGAAVDDPAWVPLEAAVAAWNHDASGRASIERLAEGQMPATGDWLIWRGGALPAGLTAWVEQGGRALINADDSDGAGRIVLQDVHGAAVARTRALGRGRVVSLVRAWSPQAWPELVEATFPDTLAALFADAPAVPARAAAHAVAPREGAAALTPPVFPLDPLLVLVIAVLFLGERWMATRRREAA